MILEFLSSLDDADCWVNGIDNRPAHMDCYMTVPEYKNLIPVLQSSKDKYTMCQWLEIIDYLNYISYLTPNASILAALIKRIVV